MLHSIALNPSVTIHMPLDLEFSVNTSMNGQGFVILMLLSVLQVRKGLDTNQDLGQNVSLSIISLGQLSTFPNAPYQSQIPF